MKASVEVQVLHLLTLAAKGSVNPPIDDVQNAIYRSDFRRMVLQFGAERLERAIESHRQRSEFFPHPSQLRAIIEAEGAGIGPTRPPETPPCPCSREALIALKGEPCEHGTRWGLATLRNVLREALVRQHCP